jgi:hypothetical protein
VTVFADHGAAGAGEPVAIVLRPGNAGPDTAADHIKATRLAVAQLPEQARRRGLIRCDSARGTHEFLAWLPLQGYAQNQISTELVALACELLAWMAMLALNGQARRREPKRLRLRLFSAAGRLVRRSRRMRLRLAQQWPSNPLITAAITRLQALAPG